MITLLTETILVLLLPCLQAGVCGCEEGYTEVMTSDGLLDQCTVIPVLEIPTAGDNKADVKTIRAFSPTQPEASTPGRAGRTWFLQPFGPGNTPSTQTATSVFESHDD